MTFSSNMLQQIFKYSFVDVLTSTFVSWNREEDTAILTLPGSEYPMLSCWLVQHSLLCLLHTEGGMAIAMVKGLLAAPAAKQELGAGTRIVCSQPLGATPHFVVYHRDLYQT